MMPFLRRHAGWSLCGGLLAGTLWWLLAPGGAFYGDPADPQSWFARDAVLGMLLAAAGLVSGMAAVRGLSRRPDGVPMLLVLGVLAGGFLGAVAAWRMGDFSADLFGHVPAQIPHESAHFSLRSGAVLIIWPLVSIIVMFATWLFSYCFVPPREKPENGGQQVNLHSVSTLETSPSTHSSDAAFLRRTDLRGQQLSLAALQQAVPRTAQATVTTAEDAVHAIIADVRQRGHAAISELAEKFDGVRQEHSRVPAAALAAALEGLDPQVRAALEESIARARAFAEAQKPANVDYPVANGAVVSSHWIPVRRVGLYVPGGLAAYPSSVVMNVVPALAAGVESVALASPPQKDNGGLPDATVLAAAALLGIDQVYAMGGAQAIAAFAYGVEAGTGRNGGGDAIEPVDVVTGPGNIFVATAKRLVKGVVGIDSEAGATEIAVLADATANPVFVAADLISQAEHDPNAASVLVTDSPELADAVERELQRQVALTTHRDRVATALSGPQSGIVLVDGIDQGVAVANAYAAEHLEVVTADAPAVAARIRNAGAIFVGDYSPVSLGDYCAGSNHVLPTSGTAAFSSGLNVTTFLRAVQLINYDKAALNEVAQHVITLSKAEGLPAHGDAVAVRFP